MAKPGQVRGVLLEEVVGFLLELTGYSVVTNVSGDPTLMDGGAGLEVLGRGANHQIDRIADYRIPKPFSNKSRLLMEAKCYTKTRVGIEVIRAAVGVLKDVSEFWATNRNIGHAAKLSRRARERARAETAKHRYHYQYAVTSSSGFSEDAQQYALAQDVYLLPLERQGFLRPLLEPIRTLGGRARSDLPWVKSDGDLHRFRLRVREALGSTQKAESPFWLAEFPGMSQSDAQRITAMIDRARELRGGLLVTLDDRYPVLLVPAADLNLEELPDDLPVEVQFDDMGWYLTNVGGSRRLFSFDMPDALILLYTEGSSESPFDEESRIPFMKLSLFSSFAGHLCLSGRPPRLLTFRLSDEQSHRLANRLSLSWSSGNG